MMDAPEGPRVHRPVIDAHVHLFPARVFEAIWAWFGKHAWPIRYRYDAERIVAYMEERGVERFFALHYAHVPGMARSLNAFVTEMAARSPRVVPFGTVLPGEPEADAVVRESLDDYGHAGLKIHCHVQKMAPDDERLFPVYEALAARGKVAIVHAGREPSSEAYGFDCRAHCGVARVRAVVERFPELRLVVPHLGSDEWREFFALARDAPNLYLDTAVAVGGYLTDDVPGRDDVEALADRILFGTDFPQLAYPWNLELDWLLGRGLSEDALAKILHGNAQRLAAGP